MRDSLREREERKRAVARRSDGTEREAAVQRAAQGGASSAGKEGVCMAGAARQTPRRQRTDSEQSTRRHRGRGADGGAVARGTRRRRECQGQGKQEGRRRTHASAPKFASVSQN